MINQQQLFSSETTSYIAPEVNVRHLNTEIIGNVRELVISGAEVICIDLRSLFNLVTLQASSSILKMIIFGRQCIMRKLSIDHTEVSHIPATTLLGLEKLKIQCSNIQILDTRYLRNMKRIEMSMTQSIIMAELISCKFDTSDVEVSGSATTPTEDECDTRRYFNLPIVSLGSPSYVEIGDNVVQFADNVQI